jgi:NCS1 family nucleobase:cation symporter-1
MFGFWFSDAMNAQSWEAPATILAAGLTWSVAPHCFISPASNEMQARGYCVHHFRKYMLYRSSCFEWNDRCPSSCAIPRRNSFRLRSTYIHFHLFFSPSYTPSHLTWSISNNLQWYFAKFAIIVRMTTALFWHAIQTYTGSTAMTQCIRAIWPSYLNIPNHIPESVGITTQQMVSHFIFWSVQFPFLLTPPHKLQWFFIFKVGMYSFQTEKRQVEQ